MYSASSLESRIYIFYDWVMVTCEYLSNRMFSSIHYWYSYRGIILLNNNLKMLPWQHWSVGLGFIKIHQKVLLVTICLR